MKLNELLENNSIREKIASSDFLVKSIAYDSRKVEDDCLFVAIKGFTTDGHKYIDSAIDNGAKAIICNKLPNIKQDGISYYRVDDPRTALAEISAKFYGYPQNEMKIIGITGTNGKTTTTYILNHILNNCGKQSAVIGTTGIFSKNKKIEASHTTPESLELFKYLREFADDGIEYVVMEVSSHGLEQKRVHGIKFDIALFTNLSHEHLDYHKTIDKYAQAKKLLFFQLKQDGAAIYNNDDEFSEYMIYDIQSRKYPVGRKHTSRYRIINELYYTNRTEFTIIDSNFNIEYPIEIKLPGAFNIENASLAFLTALSINIPVKNIINELKTAQGAPGRMQLIELKSGAVGIVDYAHTPDALEKALIACRNILVSSKAFNSKLLCVFGCGGDRDKSKRPLMGKIASANSDLSIITNDNPRTENPENIIKDILTGVDSENHHKIEIIPDRDKAIERAVIKSTGGDIILVAGKGHETYQIIGTEKTHFDDVEQLEKYT